MTTERKNHWEQVYSTKTPEEVSWYQKEAQPSLELIQSTGADPGQARIIDIGGGASVLTNNLLNSGFRHITVLDIARGALEAAKADIGQQKGQEITWIESDVLDWSLKADESPFDIWHDRAVFHFLTSPMDRKRYIEILNASVAAQAHAIIATFASDGPMRCSGLDVVRYSPESLHAELGDNWEIREARLVTHQTPWDAEQRFIYCLFRKL